MGSSTGRNVGARKASYLEKQLFLSLVRNALLVRGNMQKHAFWVRQFCLKEQSQGDLSARGVRPV